MSETNGTANGSSPGSASAANQWPLNIFAALQSRAALSQRLGEVFDGRRNMHQLLGYKPQLQYQDFKARYRRQHLAKRLIQIWPQVTWGSPPVVQEDTKQDTDTAFEAAWKFLEERLHVYSILERTDVLACLGEYSCLLIGLKGQNDLRLPAQPVQSVDDVIYLTPYSQEFALITQLETRADQPTFGHPLTYTFQFGRGSTLASSGPTVPLISGPVHASRVIHVTVDLLDDEVYGIPALEAVYDLLDDMYKVQGGSAEMFYQDAKRRLVFALRDNARMSTDQEKALANEVEEFVHEMRNFIRVSGIDVETIAGTVASPKEHMDVILSLIAATFRVPKRLLEGSERGDLASRQDEAGFLQGAQRRQKQVAEQRMLRPLIDRLLGLNALPQPAIPYTIVQQNLLALSEEQQAAIVKDYATALNQAYGAMEMGAVIALSRTLVEALGYDPEDSILNPVQELLALAPAPTEL